MKAARKDQQRNIEIFLILGVPGALRGLWPRPLAHAPRGSRSRLIGVKPRVTRFHGNGADMSREKLIIVGVVVLGLLGVLVYRQSKNDESLGAPMASAKDFPRSALPRYRQNQHRQRRQGRGGAREGARPNGTATDGGAPRCGSSPSRSVLPANQQAVKDLVANLKDLKVESCST